MLAKKIMSIFTLDAVYDASSSSASQNAMEGAIVNLADGRAVVGDGPDSEGQYRVVRLYGRDKGPGFADAEALTDIIGYVPRRGPIPWPSKV